MLRQGQSKGRQQAHGPFVQARSATIAATIPAKPSCADCEEAALVVVLEEALVAVPEPLEDPL